MRPQTTASAWTTIIAAIIAVVVVAVMPALRATAPLTTPVQWSIADLGAEAARATVHHTAQEGNEPGLSHWLDQAQAVWQQFHAASPGQPRGVDVALALAALIPLLAIVAGLCALLCLLWALWRRRRWLFGTAIAGAASSAYVIGASWWLTHLARTQLAHAVSALQQRWGGLISALGGGAAGGGSALTLTTSLGLEPQAGLYILLLAFLVMLVMPEDHGNIATDGSA